MRLVVGVMVIVGCSSRTPDTATTSLPEDTALVANLEISKLRESRHWPMIEGAISARAPLARLRADCQLDPLRAVASITLAIPADLDSRRAILILRGLERRDVDHCASKLAAAERRPITIVDERRLTAYRSGGESFFAAWLAPHTVALTPGEPAVRDRLDELVSAPARRDRDGLISPRGHAADVTFDLPAQTALREVLGQIGGDPQRGNGWVDLADSLRGELRVRFATAEQATATAEELRTRLAAMADEPDSGSLIRAIRVAGLERDVVVSVELDPTQTRTLLELVIAQAR